MSRPRRLSAHERRVLATTCLASLGSYYTMAVTGFALPQIQRGLAIPEDAVGSLFALMRFGTLLSLALAIFADRRGRRRLLVGSVGGCALANVATAFAPTGAVLACLQMVARCFVGGQTLLASVVVTEELAAEHRGRGLGLLSAVGGMGGALALAAFACVDRLPYGWRALFVLGGFGILCVPWLRRSLHETRRFADQGAVGSPDVPTLYELVRRYRGRLAVLVGILAPVTLVIEPAMLFVSKHLQDDLGYTPGGVGLLMAGCGVAMPLGNVMAGIASDRLGRRPVTILASLMLSVAVALFYGDAGSAALAVGLAMLFASIGGLNVLHTAIATELFPTAFRSTAAGVREAVATVGASAGLWVLSLLYPMTGGHAHSLTWLLVVTPISPLVLLFLPETARRELEEIAPGRVRAG